MDDRNHIGVGGLDHAWLYAAPSIPDAMKWSDDNLIAVASMQHVTIIDPGRLDGPRATITLESCKAAAEEPCALTRYVPFDAWKCGSLSREMTQEMLKGHDSSSSFIRGLAWGPIGSSRAAASASKSPRLSPPSSQDESTWASGCALSLVTANHRVKLYLSPSSSSSSSLRPLPSFSWIEAIDMTNELKSHMESVSWKDKVNHGRGINQSQEKKGGGGEGDVLRLRGGGGERKRKKPSIAEPVALVKQSDDQEQLQEEREQEKGLKLTSKSSSSLKRTRQNAKGQGEGQLASVQAAPPSEPIADEAEAAEVEVLDPNVRGDVMMMLFPPC